MLGKLVGKVITEVLKAPVEVARGDRQDVRSAAEEETKVSRKAGFIFLWSLMMVIAILVSVVMAFGMAGQRA